MELWKRDLERHLDDVRRSQSTLGKDGRSVSPSHSTRRASLAKLARTQAARYEPGTRTVSAGFVALRFVRRPHAPALDICVHSF